MFSISKMSPQCEEYLLQWVEYYRPSTARRTKRTGVTGQSPDEGDSSSRDPDDNGMGLADAELHTLDIPGELPGTWFHEGAADFAVTGMTDEERYRRVFRDTLSAG